MMLALDETHAIPHMMATSTQNDGSGSSGGASLAAANSATLGAHMPEVTLPDGSKIQTGTVGALIVNIGAYNAAHAQGDEAAMGQIREKMRLAMPVLRRAGLMEVFTPDEWIAGGNEGRKVVGRLYKEFLVASQEQQQQ